MGYETRDTRHEMLRFSDSDYRRTTKKYDMEKRQDRLKLRLFSTPRETNLSWKSMVQVGLYLGLYPDGWMQDI